MNPDPVQAEGDSPSGVVIAVLMPHAPVLVPEVGGDRWSEVISTVHAMREAARRVVAAGPDALVVVSPHSPRRSGAFGVWRGKTVHGSLAQFGVGHAAVSFPIEHALCAAITTAANSRDIKTWEISDEPLDHGAVVPLWFLAEAGWRGPAVIFGLNYPGEGGHRELGEVIAKAVTSTGRRIAFLASGDMSHRLKPGAPAGFDPRAAAFDHSFIELIRNGSYRELQGIDPELQDLAAEDVVDSTIIAAAATRWQASGREVLSYEGPFGVGYGVAVLFAREAGP